MSFPAHQDPKQRVFGPYQVIRKLGHGGMGEVFLAYDTICHRRVALKKIREDLLSNQTIRDRFVREATLTAGLIHPAIIPIYSICSLEQQLYYIMPYVEGETLKQILIETRQKEKAGATPHPIGSSIGTLARIFLSICQAISYCHSKKILHRDLKPENIIIGPFGQVVILDWGLAHQFEEQEQPLDKDLEKEPKSPDLTRPGKIHGTLSHLAPERIMGAPSSTQTDIYSLGVILYHILTLSPPFHRGRFKETKRLLPLEKIVDPQEMAPHRAIPVQLSEIAKKCLSKDLSTRYHTVDEIISDLENFILGKPDWIFKSTIDPFKETGWEFQENVLISPLHRMRHSVDLMEWVMLMISKESFTSNLKIETDVYVEEDADPLSFLLAISEPTERHGLEDGFRITIGTEKSPGADLARQGVEVCYQEKVFLEPGKMHTIVIERVDQRLSVFIDRKPVFDYHSLVPITGNHIGLLIRPGQISISPLRIFEGSHPAQVGCLTLPDTYFASKDFTKAKIEYRRIADSFKGREEGYLALFRFGITLIEQAKDLTGTERSRLLHQAMDVFDELVQTQGAPLAWIGKSILYAIEQEHDDEIRCLELALRKYPKHPLLLHIEDRVFFRLYECSKSERILAYEFAMIALRHSKELEKRPDASRLIDHLIEELPPLFFIEKPKDHPLHAAEKKIYYATLLATFLQKPRVLCEILDQALLQFPQKNYLILNILYALARLGEYSTTRERFSKLIEQATIVHEDNRRSFNLLQIASISDTSSKVTSFDHFFEIITSEDLSFEESRLLLFLLDGTLEEKAFVDLSDYLPKIEKLVACKEHKAFLEEYKLYIYLYLGQIEKASGVLSLLPSIPKEFTSLWLITLLAEDKNTTHYLDSLVDCPFPALGELFAYYHLGKIDLKEGWIEEAFVFEKLALFRQLALYCHLTGKWGKAVIFDRKLRKLFESSL